MRFKLFIFLICLIVVFISCKNKKETSEPARPLYAQYAITCEEGAETVTCLLQFREEGKEGNTVLLEPPASVTFDGTVLQSDSAALSGAYYEVQQPAASFAGRHRIVLNTGSEQYKEDFLFEPFTLAPFDSVLQRGDVVLQLNGLQPTDYLRVLVTDTSFTTTDINQIDTIQNGRLVITEKALRQVTAGPLQLYIFKEEDRPLQNAPKGGGRLALTYGLQRSLMLKD